jgi:hypothetical protein
MRVASRLKKLLGSALFLLSKVTAGISGNEQGEGLHADD